MQDLPENHFHASGASWVNIINYYYNCYIKNITCLFQLFFQNNQGGEETTVVDYIGFIGSPVDTTNMEDFKRVIWGNNKDYFYDKAVL